MVWSHLIRFIAKEDLKVHLGQLTATDVDVGLESLNGNHITAYEIEGSVFDGKVTDKKLTVEKLLAPVTREQCDYIRCVGLNYKDHAKEANLPLPKVPALFSKPRSALIGPYPDTVTSLSAHKITLVTMRPSCALLLVRLDGISKKRMPLIMFLDTPHQIISMLEHFSSTRVSGSLAKVLTTLCPLVQCSF